MRVNKTCCVFGHRKIEGKEKLKERLMELFDFLIRYENVDTFLLGSKSEFDDLCCEVLAVKKEIYPHIKRVYVRAEYPHIYGEYQDYIMANYENTYFPKRAMNAGKGVYIERNFEMIDKSDICVIYFKDGYLPPERKNSIDDLTTYQPKSGTGIAYKYARKKDKIIVNLAE